MLLLVTFGAVPLAKADWVWSRQIVPGVGKVRALAYGNGIFVAGTSTGYLLSSRDAVNWTPSRPVTLPINDVAFGDDRFVAVVDDTSRTGTKILYSGNGTTWSYAIRTANQQKFSGQYGLSDVASINGNFIALGGSARAFATSVNGNRWQYPLQGDRPRGLVNAVVGLTGRRQYVQCSSLAGVTIQTSKDGFEWKTQFQTSSRGPARDIAAQRPGGRRVVCVGENGLCLTSANDGETWRSHPFGAVDFLGLAWTPSGLFVGFTDKSVYSSSGGQTWARQLQLSRRADHLRAIVGGSGFYVAAGASGADALIMTSTGVPAPPPTPAP